MRTTTKKKGGNEMVDKDIVQRRKEDFELVVEQKVAELVQAIETRFYITPEEAERVIWEYVEDKAREWEFEDAKREFRAIADPYQIVEDIIESCLVGGVYLLPTGFSMYPDGRHDWDGVVGSGTAQSLFETYSFDVRMVSDKDIEEDNADYEELYKQIDVQQGHVLGQLDVWIDDIMTSKDNLTQHLREDVVLDKVQPAIEELDELNDDILRERGELW